MYAFNALYAADREAALALRERQNEQVTGDLRRYSAYLARYTGPVMTVGTTVNNLYLKSMGQSDGVRSYGRMVDLLCAWCIDETGESRALLNQEL